MHKLPSPSSAVYMAHAMSPSFAFGVNDPNFFLGANLNFSTLLDSDMLSNSTASCDPGFSFDSATPLNSATPSAPAALPMTASSRRDHHKTHDNELEPNSGAGAEDGLLSSPNEYAFLDLEDQLDDADGHKGPQHCPLLAHPKICVCSLALK